nr:Unknown Function [uncultured bacterium]
MCDIILKLGLKAKFEKMTIYISHSTKFDFQKELYIPIRKQFKDLEHTFILPHEEAEALYNSHELFFSGKCDLVIAEVSYPSTGQGIELGWANAKQIPIACIHKKDSDLSKSLSIISKRFLSYTSRDDMIGDITTILKQYES